MITSQHAIDAIPATTAQARDKGHIPAHYDGRVLDGGVESYCKACQRALLIDAAGAASGPALDEECVLPDEHRDHLFM